MFSHKNVQSSLDAPYICQIQFSRPEKHYSSAFFIIFTAQDASTETLYTSIKVDRQLNQNNINNCSQGKTRHNDGRITSTFDHFKTYKMSIVLTSDP